MAKAKEIKKTSKKTPKTDWVKMKSEEVEKLVLDLSKKGNSPEKIGLILRDEYGIPKVKILGKKIGKILKANNTHYQSDVSNVSTKIENLKKHFEKNKHDYTAQRKIIELNSRLGKIKAYHKID